MLSTTDKQIVSRFKTLLQEQGVLVEDLVVFGSRARGDADSDSDLDILVVVRRKDKEVVRIVDHCAWEIGFNESIIIQPVVMTHQQAYESPERVSLLMQAVREEGVRV